MENGRTRKKDSARLAWDSKPRRAPNPKDIEFQTAEVVIPNPIHREQLPLSFKDGLIGESEIDKQEMNRLIWGDNLLAMQALLNQGYEGKINLIYIDPPFDSKADYSHKMTIRPDSSPLGGEGKGEGLEFTKEPSVIERLAYKDTWAGGTDSYLDMLYPRLQLMKRLLAEDGAIYVHCDYRTNAYIRLILDEVFSKDQFLNEIIWCYSSMQKSKRNWNRKHDIILMYVKTDKYNFNADAVLEEYEPDYRERFKYKDDKGYYMIRGKGGAQSPIHSQGDLTPEHEKLYPGWTYRQYLKEGGYPKDWWEIDFLNSNSKERTGYDTQKPSELL